MLVRLESLVSSLVIDQYFRCHHQHAFNLPSDELHDFIYFGAVAGIVSRLCFWEQNRFFVDAVVVDVSEVITNLCACL